MSKKIIYLDDAIDALKETFNPSITKFVQAKLAIENLPSAQPEIIRCNACKHWTQTTGKMRGFGLGDCDFHNAKLVNCNGYCYWAERESGSDNRGEQDD